MYRWAKTADKTAIMALWAIDFESYEPYYSWYFNTVYQPELTLCDFEDGSLAAMLQLAPYTLSLRGAEQKICYVVGMITDPAFRGQGRGHALLRWAHQYLREQGYAAVLHYTDIPEFYAPLGYRHCYEQQTLRLPVDGFATLTGAAAGGMYDAPTDDLCAHIPALQSIYQSMTEHYDGYICRTEQNWRIYLGEHACDGARLLLDEERAYALYTVDKEKLHLIELGFSDREALVGTLFAVARHAQEAGNLPLLWHAPCNAPLLLPRIPGNYWQPRPFVMALPLDERAAALFAAGQRPMWINEYT